MQSAAARESVLDGAIVEQLRARIRGPVVAPDDPGYETARKVWNGSIDRRPALIVGCTGTTDVVEAVRRAREQDLRVSVRGGGHDVGGHAVADGAVMIDLSPMRGTWVDPARRVARAQGGVLWGELDRETALFGLATTGGQISTTGVGGLTLGGGIGWLMRHQGLTVDNLLSVDLVTAEGQAITASEAEHPDLFWGLRGAGWNFGVATSFEYRLHPVSTVLAGSVMYPIERAGEVLQAFRSLAADAPDELTALAYFLSPPASPFLPPEVHGRRVAALAVCFTGPLEEGQRLVASLRSLGQPLSDGIRPMPYWLFQRMFDAGSRPGFENYWRSPYLEDLSDAAIETLVTHVGAMSSPLSMVLLTNMGGAVARVPEGATAFSHRAAPLFLEIIAKWAPGEVGAPHVTWADAFFEAVQPYSNGGIYVNFVGDEGPARVRDAYTPDNYRRLVELKRRYDPTNFFRLNQNIAPAETG